MNSCINSLEEVLLYFSMVEYSFGRDSNSLKQFLIIQLGRFVLVFNSSLVELIIVRGEVLSFATHLYDAYIIF